MERDIAFIQELVKCTTGISLHCIEDTNEAISAYIRENTPDIFRMLFEANTPFERFRTLNPGCIYEFYTPAGTCYLMFSDPNNQHLLLIGPTLTDAFAEPKTMQRLYQNDISYQTGRRLAIFCEQLPIVSIQTLHQLGAMVFRRIKGTSAPVTIRKADYLNDIQSHMELVLTDRNAEISQMRQVEIRYENSTALLEAVKHGNVSLAVHLLGSFHAGRDTAVRNANPLRNTQNYCIILNSLLRHALEECGIHPYLLDAFSNDVGLHIEQLKSQEKADSFIYEIIRQYCKLAQEHSYRNLTPLIHLAVTYIKDHLSDTITVKETARALTVNANYLSYQFHADMGMTFIEFLNRERVKQAANLLRHTNLQIQEIASAVGYNNTSYFAKQFMRFKGMSPSLYRRQDTK